MCVNAVSVRSRFMGICFSIEEKHVSHSDSKPKPNSISTDSVGNVSAAGSMNIKELREGAGYSNVLIFTYNELRLATKQFRPDFILGEGGFGVVYKGVIDDSVRAGYKSTEVAIKELNREGFQGDREWLATRHAEMEAIDLLLEQRQKNRLSMTEVAKKFSNCSLYVTCEPCRMCAPALSNLGIKEVFYGCSNDKFGGCGSILSLHLSDAVSPNKGFKCAGGIMAKEAVLLFRTFYEQFSPIL